MTRTQLIVKRNRRRKEIRRKVHRFIVSVAGLIAVTIMILAWTDAAAAEGDTYIKQEYVEYCEEIGQQYGIAPELLEGLMAYNLGEYSETFREHMESGKLTDYADRIIKRSDYLQELHGR